MQICEFGDVAYFRQVRGYRSQGEWRHFLRVRTTKDVKKGSELITDYGSAYWEDNSRSARPPRPLGICNRRGRTSKDASCC